MKVLAALPRNRTVIGLFALMVLLPASVFAVLMVRDLRNEQIRAAYQRAERQRQIVRLATADLANWIFATRAESAMSKSLFRFRIAGGTIVFADRQLTLSLAAGQQREPLASFPESTPLTTGSIAADYFPRIQAFLRDFDAGRNTGAQFFVRLRALVVRLPGRDEGYVLDAMPLIEYVNQRLEELCAGEDFAATLSIGNPRSNAAAPAAGAFVVDGFPLFQIVFHDTGAGASPTVRQHAFAYSITLLVLVTTLGTILVYRVTSQEVRLSRLRTDFVAAVSHEFRSPLSSILALSERLEAARVHDPEKLRRYHEMIGQEARRLGALVTRLLNFAQIEEGKKVYSLERMELSGIALDATQACQPLRPGCIQFCDEDAAASLSIRADRTALQHSIQNLIENAVKYSPPESPVTVRCGRVNGDTAPRGYAFVEVQDRGIGIPPSEVAQIFNKFFRGQQASELNRQGVGIGLALVKHVVDGHGGSISVDSEVGRGTRFRLLLPIVEMPHA